MYNLVIHELIVFTLAAVSLMNLPIPILYPHLTCLFLFYILLFESIC